MTFVLYGAGGGYREISFVIQRAFNDCQILGAVVTDPDKESGSPQYILGDEGALLSYQHIVLAMGNPIARLEIGTRLDKAGFSLPIVIDPTVIFDQSNSIYNGAVISPGAIFTVNAVVGFYAWICAGVIIGHDSIIGDGTVIFPGAIISGTVKIGSGTMIGAGSRILPGLTIGNNVSVGAGAVVTKDVYDGETVVGIPAHFK